MLARCREELVCDLAETYHVLDPFALPARRLAVLACGLRGDSRVVMKLTGRRAPERDLLLAAALDRLSLLVWAKTKDAVKGRNRPDSVLSLYLGEERAKEKYSLDSAEAFEAFRASFFHSKAE